MSLNLIVWSEHMWKARSFHHSFHHYNKAGLP